MKTHQTTLGKTNEWLTPPEIIKSLGSFNLDPCSPLNRPWDTARKHYSKADNGLSMVWEGRVWCNPPFDRRVRHLWMQKMAEHNYGTLLVPAACETQSFFEHVYGKATGILMMQGRPHFHLPDGTRASANSGCTICLVSYGDYDFRCLINSGLGEVLIAARDR